MFKEYDIVINKKVLVDVPKGTMGTVLICYEDSDYYEVEFTNEKGDTLNVLTVSGNDLMAYDNY